MSTLTVPAGSAADASLRPVPWPRMAGVIWRQHRVALVAVVALLGGLTVLLWIVGLQGAPLLAREMETGTFRYAWTQGFGRWRWALAKLVSLAIAVTVPAWLFSLLLSWYYQPYFATGNQPLGLTEYTPFFPGLYDLHGPAFAAWTLAAFAVGALAGMVIRRVVPAIAATIAIYAGLAFAAGTFVREHYLTPLVTTSLNLPGSAWILGQWRTKGGTVLSQAGAGHRRGLRRGKASGFSEDQLFELVICAAVGQSVRLYEAGLAALAEATASGEAR